MGSVIKVSYVTPINILYTNEGSISFPVIVDAASVTADADGNKILKAGTPVKGKTTAVLQKMKEPVIKADTAEAELILLNDANVTRGDVMVAALHKGYVNEDKIPAITAEAKTALKHITFIKE